MEAFVELDVAHVSNPRFFDAGVAVALPPGRTVSSDVAAALNRMAAHGLNVVVFATSGSTGEPKWVVISKRALLTSAEMVCEHLKVEPGSRWLCPLPVGHVGGVGVYLRAIVSGGMVVPWEGKWDAQRFADICEKERVQWTSLVPTQVHDLVKAGVSGSLSLCGVVVGGGALDPVQKELAVASGWPILESFGMTETASQIATARLGKSGMLEVISPWDFGNTVDGRLKVRGPALFEGYLVVGEDGDYKIDPHRDEDGWFVTNDLVRVSLAEGSAVLRPQGRMDDLVKILGELVSVSAVERKFLALVEEEGGDASDFAVVAVPEERRGSSLVLVSSGERAKGGEWREMFNKSEIIPVESLRAMVEVDEIPRSALGKILRKTLQSQVLELL